MIAPDVARALAGIWRTRAVQLHNAPGGSLEMVAGAVEQCATELEGLADVAEIRAEDETPATWTIPG